MSEIQFGNNVTVGSCEVPTAQGVGVLGGDRSSVASNASGTETFTPLVECYALFLRTTQAMIGLSATSIKAGLCDIVFGGSVPAEQFLEDSSLCTLIKGMKITPSIPLKISWTNRTSAAITMDSIVIVAQQV